MNILVGVVRQQLAVRFPWIADLNLGNVSIAAERARRSISQRHHHAEIVEADQPAFRFLARCIDDDM